jgi:hypothetical protein
MSKPDIGQGQINYRSWPSWHKVVQAVEILDVLKEGDPVRVIVATHTGPEELDLPAATFAKYPATVGAFVVRHDDEHLSASPRQPFIADYTQIMPARRGR